MMMVKIPKSVLAAKLAVPQCTYQCLYQSAYVLHYMSCVVYIMPYVKCVTFYGVRYDARNCPM